MSPASQPAITAADPVQHVVVLMLENRSFDQMLGSLQAVYPQLEGISPTGTPRINLDSAGVEYRQEPIAASTVDPDPKHELDHVLRQIEQEQPDEDDLQRRPGFWERALRLVRVVVDVVQSWLRREKAVVRENITRAPAYQGKFVLDYELSYPHTTSEQRRQVMAYFPLGALPALHALARDFAICDHWFCSVPGPTWTNRFFVHSGTSRGLVRMPERATDFENVHAYDQVTVFDRLNERGVSWKVYFGDIPHSLVLARQLHRPNLLRYHPMEQFFQDAQGPATAFPSYSFIEPNYLEPGANDDHPPHDTMRTQDLMA